MKKLKDEILDTLKRLSGVNKTHNEECDLLHRQVEDVATKYDELLEKYGLTSKDIVKAVKKMVK